MDAVLGIDAGSQGKGGVGVGDKLQIGDLFLVVITFRTHKEYNPLEK